MEIIKLDQITKKVVEDFVTKSVPTNTDEYKRRNQFSVNKIKQDVYNGKMAEFGVYEFLSDRFEVSEPDIQVYSARQKSFDADLFLTNKNGKEVKIHVKSQHIDSANRFGKSWSFQPEDVLTFSPDENDTVCFCLVHDDTTIEILKNIKAVDLVNRYKDPKLPKLKGKKRVIYFEDL